MNTKSIFFSSVLSDRLLILCTACTNLGGSGERRSDCHEGRKPGKLAFRGEQLFKEGEKSGWGIRHRFVYAR